MTGPGSKPKVDDRGDLSGFLSRTANAAGLPSASISFKTGTRQKDAKGWEETPVTADLSGSKDAPIPHQTLVAFLAAVEKESTLKAKIGRNISKYTILGACNPVLADRALQAEPEVGLLLPCNVIVYEDALVKTTVSAMAPIAALGVIGDNAALATIATEADAKLRRALMQMEAGTS